MNIVLQIVRKPNGEIEVSGPIQDRFLCYGMMESARDVIKDFADKAREAKGVVIAAPAGSLRALANGN